MKRFFRIVMAIILLDTLLVGCSQNEEKDYIERNRIESPQPDEQTEPTAPEEVEPEDPYAGMVSVWLYTSEIVSRNGKNTKTEYVYNDQGRIVDEITYSQDVETGRITYRYNERGKLIEKNIFSGNELTHSNTYSYNDQDLIVEYQYIVDGELYQRDQYTYYGSGVLKQVQSQDNFGLDVKRYDENGNIVEWIDSLNDERRHTYRYDEKGNLLEHLVYAWDRVITTETFVYDEAGRRIEEMVDSEIEMSYHFRSYYDENGRVIKTEDLGEGDSVIVTGLYTYNEAGQLTGWREETASGQAYSYCDKTYDENGNLLEESGRNYVDWAGEDEYYRHTYVYDNNGNVVEEMYERNGNISEHTVSTYDDQGRLIEKRELNIGRDTYAYDEAGNLIEWVYYDNDGDLFRKETYTYEEFWLTPEQAEIAQQENDQRKP